MMGKNNAFYNLDCMIRSFMKKCRKKLKNSFWKGEIWNKRKDGELFVHWLTIHSVTDKEGDIMNDVAIFSDMTEHKRHVEQLN
jgi:PAS domain-containing protein